MIILLGIAGSGKGTQAEILAREFKSAQLSSGEILRRHKNEDHIQQAMAKGELVTDEVLLPIMDAEIQKAGGGRDHVILDGFPRNLNQARWIMKKIESGDYHLSGIIYLKLSQDKARERLKERFRADDTEKAIAKRFEEYKKNILPIITYFKTQGFRIREVNGDQPIKSVTKDIKKALED